MSYIRQINQQNPFWDWIGSMEGDASNNQRHPWFNDNGEGPSRRGRREAHPPPPEPDHEDGAPPPDYDDEKASPGDDFDGMTPPGSPPPEPHHPPPGVPHFHGPPPPGPGPHGRHGSHGRRGRGGHHGRRSDHHGIPQEHGFPGFPPFFAGRGGRSRRGPGGFGWWGRGGPAGGWAPPHGWNMEGLSQALKDNFDIDLTGGERAAAAASNKDFKPPVDVFDTPEAFVVHVSLAGAKKQDLGVSWDPEKSELSVAGVIHRPGDEDFLKTLAMDERDIGAFERKIKLGSKAHPVSVDADGITAKMEDGVLMVKVPKVEEFVEVKKVDIQ